MKSIALLLIKLYQILISPFLGKNCRFYPSCSSYVKDCFESFPVRIALWYAMVRILKCHPFHKGGFDPVKPRCCSQEHSESIHC